MLKFKSLFGLSLIFFAINSMAYVPKDGNLSATIGVFTYQSDFSEVNNAIHPSVFARPILIVNGDLNNKGSLEISMIHMNKLFLREENSKYQFEKVQQMHIGMGYRRWLNPMFSWSAAIYSEYPMNKQKVIYSDFAPGTEITTSASDKTEYGLDLSFQVELWGNNYWSVITDARYAASFTNKRDEKGNYYGIVLGLKHLFQERIKKQSTSNRKDSR